MPELIMKGTMGVMLLLTSIQDVIQKKICIWMVAAGGILCGSCILINRTVLLQDSLGGMLVGAVVIIISKATAGKIGMGDGLILCVTGIGLGFWGNIELFAYALFAAAVVSIVLLILRLADRKKSIPFVPFLLLSYIFVNVISSS
jgi:leader peptidase (prepilin peptidase)/N-methyltransferase